MNKIYKLAKKINTAKTEGGVIKLEETDVIKSIKEAYEFQDIVAEISNMNRCGWKVGATSYKAQKELNTKEPVIGPVFKEYIFNSPANFSVFSDQNTSVECEFAFKFKKDLPFKKGKYNLKEILSAIDCLVPVIEIIGSRYKSGFKNIGAIKLITDMVVHIALIIGNEINKWENIDLNKQNITLYKNGTKIVNGNSSEVLGSPFNVVEWAVNHLSSRRKSINKGDIISTGTCTGIVPIFTGDKILADFNEIGVVELNIS